MISFITYESHRQREQIFNTVDEYNEWLIGEDAKLAEGLRTDLELACRKLSEARHTPIIISEKKGCHFRREILANAFSEAGLRPKNEWSI